MEEKTNLLDALHRTKTSIDTDYVYLKLWLQANDLLKSKHFVCWVAGKIPINIHTGGNAQCNNPQTWGTFEECLTYKKTHSSILGVGIMLGLDETGRQLVGVDIDHITQNNLFETMNDIVHTIAGYQEISQSGDGVHIITFGKVPKGIRRKNGLEIYDDGRYIALTGTRVFIDTEVNKIADQDKNIEKVYLKYFGKEMNVIQSNEIERPIYAEKLANKPRNIENTDLVTKILASTGGAKFSSLYSGNWQGKYESQSEADMALCSILAFWTQKNATQIDKLFRQSGLMRDKWDKKERDTTYGAITINSAISKCGVVYNPEYNLSPAVNEVIIEDTKSMQDEHRYLNVGKNITEDGEVVDFDLNDTGNARRFCTYYNDIVKYNRESCTFMVWNGSKWVMDNKEGICVKPIFDNFIDNMKADMISESDKDIKKAKARNLERLYSHAGKVATLSECGHQSNMPTCFNDYDVNDYYLNTPNGVLDLINHTTLSVDKKFMQSQTAGTICNNMPTPLWDKFLHETFADQETIDFVQKAVGQTLIGNNKEQKFFMLYGNGANGKSVFLNVMQRIFGDYAKKVKMAIFTSDKIADNAERVFAPLQKTRLLIANEIKEGKSFEVGILKDITGGGNIQGRYLYGEMFEYEPKFTLWMAVNTKPFVNDESDGFWRRAVLIECPNAVEHDKIDRNLEDKLMTEAPGVLNWCFVGATKVIKEGLKLTDKMLGDVSDYQKEMSTIDRFLDDRVDNISEATSKACEVYNAYYTWAKRDNQVPMNATKFGRKMGAKFNKVRKSDGMYYIDCALKKEDYLNVN